MKLIFQKKFFIAFCLLLALITGNTKVVKQNNEIIIDHSSEQQFQIYFTDGYKVLTNKLITFKNDGMYEGFELLMKYELIETVHGMKCHVQSIQYAPPKFVDEKIFKPKCISRFKYNNLWTYIGSKDIQCSSIMKYIVRKMTSTCMLVENGPNNKFLQGSISLPLKGEWAGYIFYSCIPTAGDDAFLEDGDIFKLEVKESLLRVTDTYNQDKFIFYKNINWNCNDDGPCTIDEYVNYLLRSKQSGKIPPIRAAAEQVPKIWDMQDYIHCFIVEELQTHLICPSDVSEETALKSAISFSMDKYLIDAKIERFILDETPNGEDPNKKLSRFYRVIHSTSSKEKITDYDILVSKDNVRNLISHSVFLDYSHIASIEGIPCAFEFRLPSLPNQYHEINPLCCARYVTTENNFICVQQQSKCYIPLRRMILQMRNECLVKQKILVPQTKIGKFWSGAVIFFDLDNYKFRGAPAFHEGFLYINSEKIKYSVNGKDVLVFPLISLNFMCASAHPCSIRAFRSSQDRFLQEGLDKEWQNKSFEALEENYPDLKINDDCMVIISEIASVELSRLIVTCSKNPELSLQMKDVVIKFYNEMAARLDNKELHVIHDSVPLIVPIKEMKIYLISKMKNGDNGRYTPTSTVIQIKNDGLYLKASGEFLIKFNDLIDIGLDDHKKNTEKAVLALNETDIPQDMKDIDGINLNCCVKIESPGGQELYICITSGERCLFDKISLFKFIVFRVSRFYAKAKKEYLTQVASINKTDFLSFHFGLSPSYRPFSDKFNFESLNADLYDNSKSGIWEGWVYETSLVDIDYLKVIKPVFLRLNNGQMKFYTEDDDEQKPYKTLHLVHYNQLCPEHCYPSQYIKKRIEMKEPFDDIMHLQDAIISALTQNYQYMAEKGCIVIDLVTAHIQFGLSHLICSLDLSQGTSIRRAIDVSYYQSLLSVDVDSQVRSPFLENDKYMARMIINNKLLPQFNQFYFNKEGLVGKVAGNENGQDLGPSSNSRVFKLKYANNSGDTEGEPCAFWYKNLKIRGKNQELAKAIADDNCCFRFFTQKKTKIEICALNSLGKTCIKHAMELMKGMKRGCRRYKISHPDDETRKEHSIFKDKGFDDSENGVFRGFVYAGSATDSAQEAQINPYYVEINHEGLLFYLDHQKTKIRKFSIPASILEFDCNKRTFCSPLTFKKYAESTPRFTRQTSSIRVVYNLFKDMYGFRTDDILDQQCFVLESVTNPWLICPYIPETKPSLIQAIINAFIIHYSKISLIEIPLPGKKSPYHIVHSFNGQAKEHHIIIKSAGVYDTFSNLALLDISKIDKDPIGKISCAFWYKNILIPFDTQHPECCFQVGENKKPHIFCIQEDGICIKKSFELMKEIWNECEDHRPLKNTLLPSPDSQILGDSKYTVKIKFDSKRARYDIIPRYHSKRLIPHEFPARMRAVVSIYNDISYSNERTYYKGWFDVFPLDLMGDENKFSKERLYGELSPEGLKFYIDPNMKRDPRISINPGTLSMSCSNGEACRPMKFQEVMRKRNKFYSFLERVFKGALDMYEHRNDNGCAVLENTVGGSYHYYYICVRIRKTLTQEEGVLDHLDPLKTAYTDERTRLASHYGCLMRRIIYTSYLVSRKHLTYGNLPDHAPKITKARMTLNNEVKLIYGLIPTDEGLSSGNMLIVNYKKSENCDILYNLVNVPSNVLKGKIECCLMFKRLDAYEVLCNDDVNCEYTTLALARKMNEMCNRSLGRDDELKNVFTIGDEIGAKRLIQRLMKENIHVTEIERLNTSPYETAEDFIGAHKGVIAKYLLQAKEIMHQVQLAEIQEAELQNNHQNHSSFIQVNNSPDCDNDNDQDTVSKAAQMAEQKPHENIPEQLTEPKAEDELDFSEVEREQERILAKHRKIQFTASTKQFEVTRSMTDLLRYKDKINKNIITIFQRNIFIKTKEFSGIFMNGDLEYDLLLYHYDGARMIEFEKDILITDSKANLHKKYEGLIVALKLAEIELPE